MCNREQRDSHLLFRAAAGTVADGIDDAELDTDRLTSFVYDDNRNVTKQVAHQPDSSDDDNPQKTIYTYGVLYQYPFVR